jgi:hypothetical protein
MKIISLTLKEFFDFKSVATFIYEFSISGNNIIIEASVNNLESLGY